VPDEENGVAGEIVVSGIVLYMSKIWGACIVIERGGKGGCAAAEDRLTRYQVTYNPPQPGSKTSITIPLLPNIASLPSIDIEMHHSPVCGLAMPQSYTDWFTTAFDIGTPVILVYLGPRYRQVLGNLAPNAKVRNPVLRKAADEEAERQAAIERSDGSASQSWAGWLGGKVASGVSNLTSSATPASTTTANPSPPAPATDRFTRPINPKDYSITFQDGASYLITSTTSLAALHTRMPKGELADMTKFRPNIVLAGADEAWEEDFWGELTFSPRAGSGSEGGREPARLLLNHNCVRCTSLNVDYTTGSNTSGTNVLKLLQRDRRVDTAQKWSPVFGRYGWLVRREQRAGDEEEEEAEEREEEFEVKVGDEVVVTRRNEERSGQKWPGWGATREDDLWPV